VGNWDGNIYAINSSDGEKRWRFETSRSILSSPTATDGTVYFGSADKNVYALDTSDGSEKWEYETGSQVLSSPSIVRNTVYIGSKDNKMYALNASTGERLYSFETGREVRSSPTVVRGTVYFGSRDGNLYAVDNITDQLLWQFNTSDESRNPVSHHYEVSDAGYVLKNEIRTSPTVFNNTVYFGSFDGNLYAINAISGEERWAFETGGWVGSSPTVVTDNINGDSRGSRVLLAVLGRHHNVSITEPEKYIDKNAIQYDDTSIGNSKEEISNNTTANYTTTTNESGEYLNGNTTENDDSELTESEENESVPGFTAKVSLLALLLMIVVRKEI
jgi:outer membrane protein assembly factor BamB